MKFFCVKEFVGKSPECAQTGISGDLTYVSGVWHYLGWQKTQVLDDC